MGFATSFLVLRGSDLTRLMVTLGISLMLFELANKMRWLTGGADGLQGVDIWPLFGVWRFDLYGRTAYGYSIVVLFLSFLIIRRIVHSPFGLALRGIRENGRRMPALGTPVGRRLVAVYTIGAIFAGIAGALLTETTQFVSLDVLSFDKSAEALLVVVLGGAGTLVWRHRRRVGAHRRPISALGAHAPSIGSSGRGSRSSRWSSSPAAASSGWRPGWRRPAPDRASLNARGAKA